MTAFAHPARKFFAHYLRLLLATFLIAAYAIAARAELQFGNKNAATSVAGDLLATTPSAVVQTEQVRAELVAHAPEGLGPGKPLQLGLWLQHQPHWHTYWKNPGDSGLATAFNWTLPAGWKVGGILWPTPAKLPVGTLANYGYEDSVLLPVPVTLPKTGVKGKTVEVALEASWLVCEKECVPQDGKFVLQLPVAAASIAHADLFATHAQAVPQPLVGKATATPTPQGLRLEVSGLPAAWASKALTLLPETPELLEPRTTPDSTQKTTSDEPTPTTQSWRNGSWSALVPYFSLRSATPTDIPMVLGLGTQGVSFTATVEGTWPQPAPPDATPLPHAPSAPAATSTETPASLPWALAAALLGGLILNLMPCVFPVLAIKVLAFSSADERGRASHRAQGLAYTAGVVGAMLALAGLMLALRAGGEQLGWGFQLQSPAVLAALALLFTLIGLNLAGVFEVGNVIPSRLAALEARHPAVDAFLSGVLAVAIASPCTAPFMGASLGYAIGLPAAQALLVFGALGLGLALPYLLASWVPQVAQWLPKPWCLDGTATPLPGLLHVGHRSLAAVGVGAHLRAGRRHEPGRAAAGRGPAGMGTEPARTFAHRICYCFRSASRPIGRGHRPKCLERTGARECQHHWCQGRRRAMAALVGRRRAGTPGGRAPGVCGLHRRLVHHLPIQQEDHLVRPGGAGGLCVQRRAVAARRLDPPRPGHHPGAAGPGPLGRAGVCAASAREGTAGAVRSAEQRRVARCHRQTVNRCAMTLQDDIRHILQTTRTCAVVGLSPKPHRDSFIVARVLQAHGWRILPVNPAAQGSQILGETVYATLADAARDHAIDLVDVFRNSEDAAAVVDEAIAVHAKAVWLQLGVVNDAAIRRARAAGLRAVQDRCTKIEILRQS